MRIAVVGGGISGLVAARLLSRQHDVTVFEASAYAGGHTNTVDVAYGGEHHAIDTGFIVFNHKTYPSFTRLLDDLGVSSQETAMSFSVRSEPANVWTGRARVLDGTGRPKKRKQNNTGSYFAEITPGVIFVLAGSERNQRRVVAAAGRDHDKLRAGFRAIRHRRGVRAARQCLAKQFLPCLRVVGA